MNLVELVESEPTMSQQASYVCIVGLGTMPWRSYVSRDYPSTNELVDRFIRAHARVQGLVTDTMLSQDPAQIFYFSNGITDMRIKGGLWINGAVLYTRLADEPPVTTLMIDDETAETWRYPDGWVYYQDTVKSS